MYGNKQGWFLNWAKFGIVNYTAETFLYQIQMHYGNSRITSPSFALEIAWIDGALNMKIELLNYFRAKGKQIIETPEV